MNMLSGIAAGFLLGLGAGATVGMLIAPKKGEELRHMLKDKAKMAREKAMQQAGMKKQDAINQARQALDKLEQAQPQAAQQQQ
jgi:gas vesicle protein